VLLFGGMMKADSLVGVIALSQFYAGLSEAAASYRLEAEHNLYQRGLLQSVDKGRVGFIQYLGFMQDLELPIRHPARRSLDYIKRKSQERKEDRELESLMEINFLDYLDEGSGSSLRAALNGNCNVMKVSLQKYSIVKFQRRFKARKRAKRINKIKKIKAASVVRQKQQVDLLYHNHQQTFPKYKVVE
jgi:hypothetical protein